MGLVKVVVEGDDVVWLTVCFLEKGNVVILGDVDKGLMFVLSVVWVVDVLFP